MTDEELNGHIERAEECRDFLHHEAMDEGDPTGKLTDFADSLRVVLEQLSSTQHRLREREEECEGLKKERESICSLMCSSNECRIRKQCTRPTACISMYAQLDYEGWDAALFNIGSQRERAEKAESQLATITRERDKAIRYHESNQVEYTRLVDDLNQQLAATKRELEIERGGVDWKTLAINEERERKNWQRIAEERHESLEATRKQLGEARAYHAECSANWERLQMRTVHERDTALQALSSAAEKGVAAGKLVGEAELEAMTKARDEACDWAVGANDKHRPWGLTVADEARIASLRRVGKEGK